ncbi:MAG: putative ABC transporter permease [Candidatus Cellulosilyticum pullistercoris]|uniref:ABC transporter permease n=1 Tax=Candidatus Cellulosilyticum pullistercoris TaxID=2838521 RepID=A0A9E2KC14_9FIRM|nr:putative ABC transporter permease [Candidatus Cellulosilyticum pullistercoris]
MSIPSNLYALLYYFFIYSFLGWLMESTINTLKQKSFINRGFLLGPYCPIYGVGMCTIYLFCFSLREYHLLVFISGMFLATLLEYLTGTLMEKLFHAKWWDYSHFRYNLNGQICLRISFAWGLLSLLFISYIHPMIITIVTYIPLTLGTIMLIILCLLFVIDFIYSTHTAFKLTTKFPALTEMRLELITLLEQSKFYEAAEELRNRFELKKVPYKLLSIIDSLKEHLPQGTDFSKIQLRERLVNKLSKYHTQLDKFSVGEKRLLKAFPSLSLTSIKTLKNKFINRGE